jgi:hypothetical protein
MEDENVFKTKTGFCHILPDKIILTREGAVGSVASVTSKSITRLLVTYGLLSVGTFYFSYDAYEDGNFLEATFFGLLGSWLAYGILISLNNSATPIIERSKIRKVSFKSALVGVTRARFEVLFEDENGKEKKRLIMLPGSLSNGKAETEKALEIMKATNLLS